MLHIHNGDSAAGTAQKADIPGEHLAWREALVCGPTPGHLPEDKFRRARVEHLVKAYGANPEKCEEELRQQSDALSRFPDHDEVVLWFEHDLFCQVQLIYLLHWFARRDLGGSRLSLISINEFPGVARFRGFGQLTEAQLVELFPRRQEVTRPQLDLGSRAWQAYSSADAAVTISLMNSDTSALPFLKSALINHIRRFPSTTNGLGRIGNVGLDLIAQGYRIFKSLFPAFVRREPEYGFGDAQLYLELQRLADASTPLLNLIGGGNRAVTNPAQMLLSTFELTAHGRAVLSGAEDFVNLNGIDQWLGGVHLEGSEAGWRWDEDAKELLVRL